MIEFNGKLTGKANSFYRKEFIKTILIFILCFTVIPLPGMINASRIFNTPITLIFHLVITLFWPFLLRFRVGKKFTVPERVRIDAEGSILYECGRLLNVVSIKSVKKVVDYGDFYYIQFPFLHLTNEVICQKELLTQGSMEEFEELFKDKLIYRNK